MSGFTLLIIAIDSMLIFPFFTFFKSLFFSVMKYSADVSNSAKSFGYYALHSESIVDPRVDVRYSALSSLATWLGSGEC